MTTKTLDTTVSQLLQDNSSVEYVDPKENPLATTPNDGLIFGQMHNGIECALCPTAKRACDRVWFTESQICEWSEMSHSTMYRRIKLLEEKSRISRCSDLNNVDVPTETGAVKTTFYNLNVLNQLAMICIESDVLNETSKKFSDILSEVETTGSYGVTQPELTDAEIMSRALEIAHRTLEAREERIKALTAERDEAIRTKAMIGSKREATAMAMASAKSRECAKLTAENAELKDAIGRGMNWRTVAMMRAEWIRDFGHEPSWYQLKKFSADFPTDMKPVKDVEEKVVLHNGSEKVRMVNRYHMEAWAKYREYEESLRVSAESRRDASK